jgi:hypothetical protein
MEVTRSVDELGDFASFVGPGSAIGMIPAIAPYLLG